MFIEFKAGEKHAAKGADISETPDAFSDCGWLLDKDEVVIDIDHLSRKQIQEFIKRFDVQTQIVWTDRGVHLYYRKVGAVRAKNGVCALGFGIETKNSSNSPNGVTIKRNGVLRTIENEGVRQVLPWFFSDSKQYSSMVGLSDGDGRNNALFTHRQKLKCSVDESDKICHFINEVLFDTPMDAEEMSTVLRSYSSSGTNNTEYDEATFIMNQYKTVTYQGGIWWWDGNEYKVDFGTDLRLRQLIYLRCAGKKTRFIDEVIKQIEIRATNKDGCDFPIRFRNGFLQDGEFYPINTSDFTPYYIDIDYDPDAPAVAEVDEYISNITSDDESYKLLLTEVMGYAMITDPERIRSVGKFFIFRGNGANGKGTLLQIMRRIYNPRNCSSLSIKELNDPRYQVTMIGKLANLGDDVQPDAINNNEMKALKNITTADTIETRRLYHQSESATFTVKLYFTANSDIKSYEKGYGYQRRVMWLPMFNTVTKPDPSFITRMTTPEALAYWIRLIVEGYQRIYQNHCLTRCDRVEEYNKQYHMENNHMAVFLDTVGVEEILGKTPSEVRDMYNEYNDDSSKAYSPKLLEEQLKVLGIGKGKKKINGTVARVFMRQKDTDQALFGVTGG